MEELQLAYERYHAYALNSRSDEKEYSINLNLSIYLELKKMAASHLFPLLEFGFYNDDI